MRRFLIFSIFLLLVYGAVNAKEPIDPAKVVWDKNSEHGPWEDYPTVPAERGPWEDYQRPGFFNITSADRRRIRESFINDDPLGFIANEDHKFYIQNATEKLPDRDEFRKRLALAAYFTAHNKGADYRFVLGNLDKILEKFFNKKVSIDEAFDRVTVLYGYSPQKIKMRKSMKFLREKFPVKLFLSLIFWGAVLGFVVFIVKFIRKRRRKIIDFIKLCFSPENYFRTSVLIIGSVIALSLICIALKVCL